MNTLLFGDIWGKKLGKKNGDIHAKEEVGKDTGQIVCVQPPLRGGCTKDAKKMTARVPSSTEVPVAT